MVLDAIAPISSAKTATAAVFGSNVRESIMVRFISSAHKEAPSTTCNLPLSAVFA